MTITTFLLCFFINTNLETALPVLLLSLCRKNGPVKNSFTLLFLYARMILFWLIVFFFGRLIFLLYHFSLFFHSENLLKISTAFWKGLRLDLSAAAYVSGLLLIIVLCYYLSKRNRMVRHLFQAINILIITAYALLVWAELPLYDEWQTKANVRALSYLSQPQQALQSVNTFSLLALLVGVLIKVSMEIVLFRRMVSDKMNMPAQWIPSLVQLPVIATAVVILGRGGIQQIPLQVSDAFFSQNSHLNYLAVNSAWHLGSSIMENLSVGNKNPYHYYPPMEAKSVFRSLLQPKEDSSLSILNTSRPNIILIILEGWSADLIEPLGGYAGVTPQFNQLASEGILFTNCYASGDRSDQGVTAILSGFPAQPTTSIISQPSKYASLPSVFSDLKSIGYHGSFLFGGQLSYGNIKSFLYHSKFDTIIDLENLPTEWHLSKLGIPDEYMFNHLIHLNRLLPQPFFSAFFNLSSHAPYDIPRSYVFNWGGNENGYVNGVWYADSCLGDFFRKVKKEPWYSNTLFILIADHGHNSPRNHPFISPFYRKIPLLFYGPVIKDFLRGKKIDKVVSQTDLPASILHQLGLPTKHYLWSKNLFAQENYPFAFYTFPNGFGWVEKKGYVVYEHSLRKIMYEESKDSLHLQQMLKYGKCYLQVLFDHYLSY